MSALPASKAMAWPSTRPHAGTYHPAMTNVPIEPPAAPAVSTGELQRLFEVQRRASRAQIAVPLALRRDRLLRMRALLDAHGPALAKAVQADFGVRSPQLTEVADLLVLRSLLSHTLKALPRWMQPQKVRTPFYLQPSHAYVQRQPLGVVGVVSPWNYPLQLALGPVITALGAGNRVMLKPSEWTPRTSELLAALVHAAFAADEVVVVHGDAALSQAFCCLPFDHLFFTGSTAVGRKVAAAAAANLTPTTLELGGKSPCVVDASCDLDMAALRIAHGKLLNAGQTCIAPDYVLLPRGREAAFAAAYRKAVAVLFPAVVGNPDYAAIISPGHLARLQALVDEAVAGGARVEAMAPGQGQGGGMRQMLPVLVFDPPANSALMTEEIFGPVLPIIGYGNLDEAIDRINAAPRPLALYFFGADRQAREKVLAGTVSGGVTVNDTLMHIAHDSLPFGGVGDSGWGSYHGEAGFLRLTQQKAVFVSSRWARGALLYPPYGRRFEHVMGLLRRWL
jgi:coniferyl-aldehyde dehydrogenase